MSAAEAMSTSEEEELEPPMENAVALLAEKYGIPRTEPLLMMISACVRAAEESLDPPDLIVLRRLREEQGGFSDRSGERCEALYRRGLLKRKSEVYSIKRGGHRGDKIDRRWFYTLTEKGIELLDKRERAVAKK